MNSCLVVLDTNVLVSALLSPEGNPAKIYRMFLSGALSLVFNAEIFEEYQDVLYRPHFRFQPNDISIVLTAIRQYGKKIVVLPQATVMIDEDDRVFYDTANNAGAYLITGNKKHYPAESFILSPSEFLELNSFLK